MNTYNFFSRECVWFHTDDDVPEAKTYMSSSFRLHNIIGNLFLGYTGNQILNRMVPESDIVKEYYGSLSALYELLEKEKFLEQCEKNRSWFLYPSNIRMIDHQG